MQPSDRAALDRDIARAAWVRSLALAIVRDANQAEDVAQDAWLAFLRSRPDCDSSLVGWFRVVIRNLVRTGSRHSNRRSDRSIDAAQPEPQVDADPALALERLETQEALLRAVRELAEPYRTVVLLRWFEGLLPVEIARRTGAPLRTVHTQTSRALAMLRERLDRRARGDRSSWMSAWLPLIAKADATSIGVFAMNTKLKILAGSVFVALATGIWLAVPEQEQEAKVVTRNSTQPVDQVALVQTGAAALGDAPAERAPIRIATSVAPPAAGRATVLVRVRDDLGPVGRFAVRVADPARAARLDDLAELQQDRPDGTAELVVDHPSFVVQAHAELHVPLALGPFERVEGESVLDVVLERLPGIRGKVIHGGRPMEGALVTLHEAIKSGRRGWSDGLLVRSTPGETARSRSHVDGCFAITLQRKGRFWIRARLAGLAPAELGPFDLDPAEGKDGLVLELTRGGTIEGSVLLPVGGSLEGELIAAAFDPRTLQPHGEKLAPFQVVATRGDGFPCIAQPDERGRFRLDQLTPGSWCVVRLPAGAPPGVHFDDGPGETPTWSNCDVSDGAVTRFDLDLRPGSEAKLIVQARLGDAALERWKCRIASTAWRGAQFDKDLELGPDGSLSVNSVVGMAVLHLVGTLGGADLHLREQRVLAPGHNSWFLELPVGSVVGSVTRPEELGSAMTIELRWERGELDALCTVRVADDGTFQIAGLPAGIWTATILRDAASRATSFDVPANGIRHVALTW